MKDVRLFISHSHRDLLIAEAFKEFLVRSGIDEESIKCSSAPGTQFGAGSYLYDEMRKYLGNPKVLVVYLLSHNFYNSTFCLNEMGAAWINNLKTVYFVLPGFKFNLVEGVIKEKEPIGIPLWPIDSMVKDRLYNLKETLEEWYGISIKASVWERGRSDFFVQVEKYFNELQPEIDMRNVTGYCIGDQESDGCKATVLSSKVTRIVIDFSKTDAKLCSAVFFMRNADWYSHFLAKKRLCFEIHSNQTAAIEIEVKLKSRDKQYEILVPEGGKEYGIPLELLSPYSDEWSDVKAVAFLFRKKNVPRITEMTIEKLRLE